MRAPAAGVVTFAGTNGDYGRTVILDHGEGVQSLFGHLQKIEVAPRQRVERGQQIALSSNSGRSTGPHLHYQVMVSGRPVNPRNLIVEE